MILRPPESTPFPCPPLFRSLHPEPDEPGPVRQVPPVPVDGHDHVLRAEAGVVGGPRWLAAEAEMRLDRHGIGGGAAALRSGEETPENQSPPNIACRLFL